MTLCLLLVVSIYSPPARAQDFTQVQVRRSGVAVISSPAIADGVTPTVIEIMLRNNGGIPIPGVTAWLEFDADIGASCVTGFNGTCRVSRVYNRAGSHFFEGGCSNNPGCESHLIGHFTINGRTYSQYAHTVIGAGPPSPLRSNLSVPVDNQLANGTAADVLRAVIIRDAYENVISGVTVEFAPTAGVRFGANAFGAAGQCTTDSAGACSVNATSLTPNRYTSAVTVAGVVMGSLSYHFVADAARLQIVKQVVDGPAGASSTFAFSLNGLQSETDSLVVVGNTSGAGAVLLGHAPARPVTITELASAQWPDAPLSASCVDLAGADPAARFGTLLGRQLLIPPDRVGPGANLRCTFVNGWTQSVSGHVFSDNGMAGGTANDGIRNGGEAGVAGALVRLSDCGGTLYASTSSQGDGSWKIGLPGGLSAGAPLCIETISATAGRMATSRERIAFAAPAPGVSGPAGLDFGSVPVSTLVQPGTRTGTPGTTVEHRHIFTAGTEGTVHFSVESSQATPPQQGWTEMVFADPSCSGSLAPDATLFYPGAGPAQRMTAGQTLCLVLQQSVPRQAAPLTQNQVRLQARFDFSNTNLSANYQVEDLTVVSSEALGLVQEVRNLTQGTSSFSTNNQARPGETLQYRISYTNRSAGPIQRLVINAATPAFTTFVAAGPDSTPAALGKCSKKTPAATVEAACDASQPAGGRGAISWTFAAPLPPGASGSVLFTVLVD